MGPTREEVGSLPGGLFEKIISFSTWAISPCCASDTIRALAKSSQYPDAAGTNGRTYPLRPVLTGHPLSSGASELVQHPLLYFSKLCRWFQVVAD